MGALKDLEKHLGKQLLEWNHARLLAYAERLERAIGTDALQTPLAKLLLEGGSKVCCQSKTTFQASSLCSVPNLYIACHQAFG